MLWLILLKIANGDWKGFTVFPFRMAWMPFQMAIEEEKEGGV